ncbi:MAG TPA: ThiF family adenylyltransferase [Candidatus Nanoarchaeia archaeon]|nr:ThiF family adenylyltransferase [Candidatus Nanoarchaeia archaeon]
MRYLRQEIFTEIGKKGQQKLRKSTVAIIGLGALGSVSAELLTRAGIGHLILLDRDIVELSNLQRQSLYDESDIGKPKAIAARKKLKEINSEVNIDFLIDDLNCNNVGKIINAKNINLILDCTDNLETRFLINDFSIKYEIPFIYSSAVGSKGYTFNVVPGKKNPCLKCFLKEAAQLDTCETVGVVNTITHIIPSVQVNEAIKIVLNKDYEKKLLFFDIWKNKLIKIKINKNKKCECCVKNNFEYLSGKKSSKTIKMCGNDIFQIKNKSIDKKEFDNLKNRLKKIGKVIDFGYCVNFENKITIFQDGRALIKAKDEKEAKSLYSKFVGN